MISNDQFCTYMAQKLGIVLFPDYGEYERSYRQHNDVIAPVCGVFNMTPMTVTPISGLFLASATANIMIAADASNVSAIRSLVDRMAATENGETQNMVDSDGRTYQVTFSYTTAYVGVERTAPNNTGKMIPVHLTVYFSIIENGISSNDVKMQLDGEDVFFTELTVSQQRITDAYAVDEGIATTAVLQRVRSFDYVVPLLSSDIGRTFQNSIFSNDENKAHLLSITVGGTEYAYMVTFGNTAGSVRAPQNVGANIAMVEGDPNTMTFGRAFGRGWEVLEKQGSVIVEVKNTEKTYIFWGDGQYTIHNGALSNETIVNYAYADEAIHTIYIYRTQINNRSAEEPSRSYVFYAESNNMTASLYTSDYIEGTGGYWRRNSRVDWGDGTESEYNTMLTALEDLPNGLRHTYAEAGEYTITVYELDDPVWVTVEGA